MTGRWSARKGLYFEKYQEAQGLAGQFPQLRFRLVEQDEAACGLARKALEKEKEKEKEKGGAGAGVGVGVGVGVGEKGADAGVG